MRLISVSLAVIIFLRSDAFAPTSLSSCTRPRPWTKTWSSRRRQVRISNKTALNVIDNRDPSSADQILKMVDDLSRAQFSPEVAAKMSNLEQALTEFLAEEQGGRKTPRPPGVPPPLNVLDAAQQQSRNLSNLQKAEAALGILRSRLQQEQRNDDSFRTAEAALRQSLEEEEVLRRAEEALDRSREAAERRKQEAIRITEAAVEAASKGQAENSNPYNNENNYSTPRTTRGTIPISRPPSQSPNDVGGARAGSDGPPGVPVLYNWVQYVDGSISGHVRGKEGFEDGSTVSTSPVPNGVKGGSVIETESGSLYFLERWSQAREQQPTLDPAAEKVRQNDQAARTERPSSQSPPAPGSSAAPAGVPSIRSWEATDDGCIAGFIYGSPNAEDGDYIETSAIAGGQFEMGSVVVTSSGSQYFLSPDQAERTANSLFAFRDLAAARKGGTITITKEARVQQAQRAMKEMEKAKPRTTFSLDDLFGGKTKRKPSNGTRGPTGIPTLSSWNRNDDGSITGVIMGSPNLDDGDLVTTSPISGGELIRGKTVTTVSGSRYFLA